MLSYTSEEIQAVVKALKDNDFSPVEYFSDSAAAVKRVLELIPTGVTVAIPGSTSVRQLGLVQLLRKRGNPIIDTNSLGQMSFEEAARKILYVDALLVSSNALTMDDKLINLDCYGNRVAALSCGPKQAVLVIGTNKLVKNVEDGISRVKNVISPYHAMTRMDKTPCATTGKCADCKSPGRICNVLSIIEKRPKLTDMAILLVGEDLGLEWNPSWHEERIKKIQTTYRETRKNYLK